MSILRFAGALCRGTRASQPGVLSALLLLALLAAGCATAPPRPGASTTNIQGLQTQSIGGVTVSVAILTDHQARERFGVNLGAKGIQVLWMRVQNASPNKLWLIRNIINADFYPPDEVAQMIHRDLPRKGFERARQLFRDESIRILFAPGTISQGVIFLPKVEGGRYVDVRLTRDAFEAAPGHLDPGERIVPPGTGDAPELRFGFALPLPDGIFDYERLDPTRTYAGMTLPELDTALLRERLEQLPGCATSSDGLNNGDPLNVVIVGDAVDVLNSLSRCGWSFTHRITFGSIRRLMSAAMNGKSYPVAPVSNLYLFGRHQDFALQRARASISQRNHMRLWLAPFRHEGRQVWIGQVSRDIGVKLTSKSPTLTTHIIDPEVDLAREYLLHSLLAEGFVDRFGFVPGAPIAPRTQPSRNLTDDPYFSDGMRVVIVLSPETISYGQVRSLRWERSGDPIAAGQTEEANKNVRPLD